MAPANQPGRALSQNVLPLIFINIINHKTFVENLVEIPGRKVHAQFEYDDQPLQDTKWCFVNV